TADVGIEIRFGEPGRGVGALYLGDLAVAGARGDFGHIAGRVGQALEAAALVERMACREIPELDLLAGRVREGELAAARIVGQRVLIVVARYVIRAVEVKIVGVVAAGDHGNGLADLHQERLLGIDHAVAVEAVCRVAGTVRPVARLTPRGAET